MAAPSPGTRHLSPSLQHTVTGLQQPLPVAHATLEAYLQPIKAAVVVALEEVDAVRRDTHLEQAKLQREFRESVDAILALQGDSAQQAAVATAWRREGSPTTNLAGSSSTIAPNVRDRELLSRLEYLEHVVESMQQSGSRSASDGRSMAPVAVESVLGQMTRFMAKADDEISNLRRTTTAQLEAWAQELATFRSEHDSMLDATSRKKFPPTPEKGGDPTLSTSASLSSFVTLGQASNMINAQVIEVANLVDAELAKMRDLVATLKGESQGFEHRLAAATESVSQLDAEAREVRGAVNSALQSLAQAGLHGDSQLKRIEEFVQQFTNNEAIAIRDEVMKMVNSENSLQSRKIEERKWRDDITQLKQEMARSLAAVERSHDDVTRLTAQQHQLYQSFQRSEHNINAVQHKVDSELRAELGRIEQVQKAYFARQEAQLASERHAAALKIAEDVQRLQEKQLEEMRSYDKRRVDDLHATQQQIRDDFTAFADSQRNEVQIAITKLKEDFATATATVNDTVTRSLNQATDTNKRAHHMAMEEFRKTTARTNDEVRRLQSQLDETTKRLNDQTQFLQNRVQQLLDEEVLRVERMGDDMALRLNTVVEDEVRRVVTTTEGGLQRAVQQLDERHTREIKTLRDEATATRQSLNTLAVPSQTISAVDSRVDVLRKDIVELYDAVTANKHSEQRLLDRARDELKVMLEAAKAELVRDLGHQLRRFDTVLVDLSREQAARNEEIAVLSSRVGLGANAAALTGTAGPGRIAMSYNTGGYTDNHPPMERTQRDRGFAASSNHPPAMSKAAPMGLTTTPVRTTLPIAATTAPQPRQSQSAARSASNSSTFVLPQPAAGVSSPGNRDALDGAFDDF